jgi:membrane protease YdiL (CAAX protease family)
MLNLFIREANSMKYMKQLVEKSSLLFSLVIVIISLMLSEIPLKSIFLSFCSNQCAGYIQGVILQSGLGILLTILLSKLGFAKACGLGGTGSWRQLWLCWPCVLLIIVCVILSPLRIDIAHPVTILLYVLVFLTTGLFEETLFRGMVLSAYLYKWRDTKKGVYLSVLLSSIFFSLAHIPDLIMDGSFTVAISGLIPCFFMDVFYAAYTLRSKSMGFTMLLHGFIDMAQNLSVLTKESNAELARLTMSSFSWAEFLISVWITLPLFLYSLFILRKVKAMNQSSAN